jgi:predicted nuclease of predicted toxin-antitoxin system
MNVFASNPDPERCIVSSDPDFAARLAQIAFPGEPLVMLTLQDEATGEVTYMVLPATEPVTVVE